MSEQTIYRFATPVELQRAALVSIAKFLDEAVRLRGVATLCLSGGSTPKAVYELLANEQSPEWAKVHFFWGDERCVPPTHHESNFLMAKNALLERLVIPDGNIHRIEAERPPAEAAQQYERELRNFFRLMENEMPRFDVTLLGLGEDGHTASLFPGTTILNETTRLVAEVYVEQFKAHRISLTYPVLNNSAVIMFLVSGSGKASILHEILEGAPGRFPAQKIQPSDGTLYWLVDEQASSHLTT
ncbi:MAG: 6-phosphogluconolactonase [bacterium]